MKFNKDVFDQLVKKIGSESGVYSMITLYLLSGEVTLRELSMKIKTEIFFAEQ